MSTEKLPDEPPTWLELESIIPSEKVREITSLSDEALNRNHGHRWRRLSARRKGMKLRDVLAIAAGE
jgi:hypothetical protein